MKTFLAIIVAVLVIGGIWWFVDSHSSPVSGTPSQTGTTTTPTPTLQTTVITAGGALSFAYPPSSYGLAVTPAQVLTTSYIPPCDTTTGFDYCLYRIGTDYAATNLESAGIRIQKRPGLTTTKSCLTAPPAGYVNLTPKTASSSDYATSVFSPLGDAGAGHYSSGALYRVFTSNSCYEFETRIGETQFANYPAGSIQQFTDADRAAVSAELQSILGTLTIASTSEKVTFPTI